MQVNTLISSTPEARSKASTPCADSLNGPGHPGAETVPTRQCRQDSTDPIRTLRLPELGEDRYKDGPVPSPLTLVN
jgi:hypothetical protein